MSRRNDPSAFRPDEDLRYLLALSLVKDIGPMAARRLLAAFHTPRKIFEASPGELGRVEGIKESQAREIKKFAAWDEVDREIEAAGSCGVRMIACTGREYPEPLRHIDGAPPFLYIKGNYREDDRFAIAMVGSRIMSDYGRKAAETIAFELASCGLTVVSGMARGIDTVSHKGALKAGGRSIAVLGCGLDNPYPPENGKLFEELALSGCVISEFPLGTPPNRENFPRRNRLISGLSLGVLVVEAAAKSGSLITAQYALDQGKDVFAVPGRISSVTSEGTNALIRKGAKLVQKAEDVIEELSPVLKGLIRARKGSGECLSGALEINDEEKAICNVLADGPKHIDSISRELGIAPARLSGLLLGLEMKGIVKQTEGKNFYIL